LGDVVDVLEETLNSVNTAERSFMDIKPALAQIEASQSNLQIQLTYLMQLRKALFHKYFMKE